MPIMLELERGTAGAIILAAGITIAGVAVAIGVSNVRASDRYVTVKGVSEREVRADIAIWPLHVVGADNDLSAAQGKLTRSIAGVRQFLARQGIDTTQVELTGFGVNDALAQQYGSDRTPTNRFVVRQTLLVRSSQLDQVRLASQRIGELASIGVVASAQYASMAAQSSGYQTDWSPILGAAGTGKVVNVARRVNTSGTQASSNAFFLKNPCNGSPSVGGALAPATIADSVPGNFVVTEGSSTGNVKTTLTSANTAGQFAIGVVSLENDWRVETSATNNQYRFVKVDGVHPEVGSWDGVTLNSNGTPYYSARTTALNGDYAFHMEMRSFVANTADAFGAALIPTIAAALGNPANCADVPRGLTLNPLGGSSCTVGVEVAKHTRFGNNCQATQLFL